MALKSSGKVQDSTIALSLQAQKSSSASLRASDIKGGKVNRNRELARNLPLDTLSSSSIALTLSNSEVSEMGLGNGSVFMIYLKNGEPEWCVLNGERWNERCCDSCERRLW